MKLILFVILSAIILLGLRSFIYLERSRILFAISSAFGTDYYVGNPANPPLSYLALGDSTAEGSGCQSLEETLPYRIAQHLSEGGYYVHVRNLAHSGARIQDLVSTQLPQLAGLAPNVVTVQIGANDATHFTNPEQYRQSYQAVLAVLEASGASRVVLADSPDMNYSPALFLPINRLMGMEAAKQNQILASLAKPGTVKVADWYGSGSLDFAKDHDLYAGDRFHPSPKGYSVWLKLITDQLD